MDSHERIVVEHLDRLTAPHNLSFMGRPIEDYSKETLVKLLKYEVADARGKLEGTGKRQNHLGEYRQSPIT